MRYLRLGALIGLWLLCSHLWAQPFETLLPLEGAIDGQADIQVFSDESQGVMLIREGDAARVLILDKALQVRKKFRVQNLPPAHSYTHLGYSYQEDKLHMCTLHRETGAYEVLTIDIESEDQERFPIDMGRLRKDNVYWGTFTYEGLLHILRLPEGEQTIRLCRFEGGETFSVREFDIEQAAFLTSIKEEISRIDPTHPPVPERTFPPAKLYHHEHNLYLSLDEGGQTLLIHIDLIQHIKTEYTLPVRLAEAKHNSVLYQGNIYQWAANQDSMALSIISLSDQHVLREFRYGATDIVDLWLNLPEEKVNGQKQRTYTQTENFLGNILQMPYLAIGVERIDEDHLQLSLGSIQLVKQTGVGGIVLEETITEVSGQSMLVLPDFVPQTSLPPVLANRRFPPPMAQQLPNFKLFMINNTQYFGYYDAARGGYYLSR